MLERADREADRDDENRRSMAECHGAILYRPQTPQRAFRATSSFRWARRLVGRVEPDFHDVFTERANGTTAHSYPLPTSAHHWYSRTASLTLPLVVTDASSGTLGISDALRDAPLLSARGTASLMQYSIIPKRSG